jgi:murein L,D-transpeptidase YafK
LLDGPCEGVEGRLGKALRDLSVRECQALYWLPVLRSLLAFAVTAAAALLAGCDSDKILDISGRHMQPLSEAMLDELDTKNMAKESPILSRIFKEESELELWKVDKSGRFALLRSYPICRWSGDLGPKIEQGDRQAPEGFYTVTPDQMNPYSHYHLAINTGFPNAFDRANGRSGASLMIHGDCASVGCYAMTDEQITEIYSLAREAFFGGQRSFQIQAYPFRMTALNMARHRNSPHLDFWNVLKEGYDHFEVTRKEPKVAVCDKHYVFDAQSSGKFNPVDRCPAYKVPQPVASAVHNKQQRDEIETAQLISRGIPAALATNGGEGGMNPVFVAALRSNGGPGTAIRTASGTIPARVHPPSDALPQGTIAGIFGIGSTEVKSVEVRVASAAPGSSSIGAFFGNLFSFKHDNTSANVGESSVAQSVQKKSQPAPASTAPGQTKATTTTKGTPEAQHNDSKKLATTKPQASPAQQRPSTEPPPDAGAERSTNVLIGALPTVQAGAFGKIGSVPGI